MKNTIQKCIIGVIGPTMGYTISLSTVEVWLRILSLLVGILVGCLSAVSIGLSIRRKWLEKNAHKHKKRRHTTTELDEEPTTTI